MKRLVAAMLSLILMLLPCMAVAEESPGAQDAYRARMGFSARNPGTTQLGILCLLYTSPSPRDETSSRMPSSA